MKNQQRRKGLRKWIKVGMLSILTLMILVFTVIAIAINFIFTPEKLTPKVVEIINQNIEGEFYCESTELTFFSSFPNFGVEIKKGGLSSQQDTLLVLGSCNVEFNLMKLLRNQTIDIKAISVKNTAANVLIDETGKLNWDILSFDMFSEEESESEFKINELYIDRLLLDNVALKYENQETKDLFSIDSLTLGFRMKYDHKNISAKLKADIDNIKFLKEGFVLMDNTKAGVDTELEYLKNDRKLIFTKGGIIINGVDLLVDGFLKRDTLSNYLESDLTLRLKAPDLKSVLDLVPEKIIQKEKINIKGEVDFVTTVKGFYGKNVYPLTELKTSIRKGEFQYVDYPGSINHIETDLRMRLDFKDKESSHFTIDHIDLQGFGISLQGDLGIKNLILQPFLNTKLKGGVDITKLNQVIPFNPDITVQGNIDVDIATSFDIREVKDQDVSSLELSGKAAIQQVDINIPKDSLRLRIKAFKFDSELENREVLNGVVSLSQVLMKKANQYIKLDDLAMDFHLDRTIPERSTLSAQLETGAISYIGSSDNKAGIKGGSIAVKLQNNLLGKSKAIIDSDFSLDSLGIYYEKRFAGIKDGKYKIKLIRDEQKQWTPYGGIYFNKMMAYSPDLGKPIQFHKTTLALEDKQLELKNAKLVFGNSDITLTGIVDNLPALISESKKTEEIRARLKLNSDYIDINELTNTFSKISEKHELFEKTPEEIFEQSEVESFDNKKLIELPKNLDFVFNSHIGKVRFGETDIEQIKGNIVIKEGRFQLSEATMKTIAADLSADLNYTYLNEKEADIRFDFNLDKIEMARLSEFLPVLDSLFPMTRSFEGLVDFRIRGVSKIDENMGLKIKTIKGVAAIQASDIMVFDSETFSDLAKTFMFKSKEKNPIEQLNVEMIINNGEMELLPSFLAIDRYELAIGGIQGLDKSYDYHLSVLKSPIPFKTGVDIKGENFDDYKISLSKAKYKYYFTDRKRLQKKADSTIIKKKEAILTLLGLKE